MPAESESQRRLFAAAAHGATFKKAVDLRKTASMKALREFSHAVPNAPERVTGPKPKPKI
jgi:hypothetical protein